MQYLHSFINYLINILTIQLILNEIKYLFIIFT